MEVENRVLLVEDEAPLRRSLEKFLERAGYTFDTCSSARDALVLAEKFHHDTIIVEYRLPDADGAVLLEKLRRIIPNAVSIMISEYDYQAVDRELAQANIGSFLQKPFDLADLENALFLARSNAKAEVPIGRVEWKCEFNLEGRPAALFK